MSTIDLILPKRTQHDQSTVPEIEPAGSGLLLTVEILLYVLIGIASAILHVWGLGERALHHDETLHAVYSWYVYQGRGYMHDPLLHGPLLYHIGALMYTLFGDNDTTARLGVAIFGTILTITPFFLRREIGRIGALAASFYLLLSPSVLYMGRFVRHDMYSLLFEMLVVVGIIGFMRSQQARWIYLIAASYGLMMVNQETSYLFLLIMGAAIVAPLLWRVWKPGFVILGLTGFLVATLVFVLPGDPQWQGENNAIRDPNGEIAVLKPGPIFGWGPLETSDNNYALRIRNRSDNDGGRSLFANVGMYFGDLWTFFKHPSVLLAMVVLIAALAVLIWSIWFRRNKDNLTPWQIAVQQNDDPVLQAAAALGNKRMVLIALAIFFAIYVVFFTGFFTNLLGIITGTTGSVLYWLGQHEVKRGGQPGHYYLVILAVYEPLVVLLSLVSAGFIGRGLWKNFRKSKLSTGSAQDESLNGEEPSEDLERYVEDEPEEDGVKATKRLTVPIFLFWWTIASVLIYSWAGEKMPWLVIHLVLPMTILAGWGFDRLLHTTILRRIERPEGLAAPPTKSTIWILIGVACVVSVFAFMKMNTAVNANLASNPNLPAIYLGLFVLCAVLFAAMVYASFGIRWGTGALIICLCAILTLVSVRNSHRLSFINGDVPREMMIYTQTSPDVARIMRRLETISMERYNDLSMPVIYDNETVWLWYFRNFTNAQTSGTTLSGPPEERIEAVVMLQENIDSNPLNRDNLGEFKVQRYPLRWWFPEDQMYRFNENWRTQDINNVSLLGRLLRAPLDGETIAQTWDFLIYRDPTAPLGSSDFVLAVRPELADDFGLGFGSSER
jgi:uncharacterized protein (TIGR03663 family)